MSSSISLNRIITNSCSYFFLITTSFATRRPWSPCGPTTIHWTKNKIYINKTTDIKPNLSVAFQEQSVILWFMMKRIKSNQIKWHKAVYYNANPPGHISALQSIVAFVELTHWVSLSREHSRVLYVAPWQPDEQDAQVLHEEKLASSGKIKKKHTCVKMKFWWNSL